MQKKSYNGGVSGGEKDECQRDISGVGGLTLEQHSALQSLSHVRLSVVFRLFATPWTTALQASLSITNSRSLLKLTSIASVMPSNHLIFCHPLSPSRSL